MQKIAITASAYCAFNMFYKTFHCLKQATRLTQKKDNKDENSI